MAEREIELLKKGTEEHLKQLYQYINFCKDTAVSIEEQNPTNKTDQYKKDKKDVERLEACTKDLIKLVESSKSNIHSLQLVLQNISHDDVEELYKREFDNHFKKKKFNEKFYSENDTFKKFRNEVWNVHNKDVPKPWEKEDDDILETTQSTQINTLCPISRVVMKNPVRSRLCKHAFEKESLAFYLQTQKDRPCPVAGCSRRISPDVVEEDLELQVQIEEIEKQKKKETLSQPTIALDDEQEEEL